MREVRSEKSKRLQISDLSGPYGLKIPTPTPESKDRELQSIYYALRRDTLCT